MTGNRRRSGRKNGRQKRESIYMNAIPRAGTSLGRSTPASGIFLAMLATVVVTAVLLMGLAPGIGGNAGLLAGGFIVAAPVLFYLMSRAPTTVFAAYAVFVPLENLVHVGGVGTLAKALGGASGAMLLLVLLLRRRAVLPDRSAVAWGTLLVWMGLSLFWALDPNFGGVVNLNQMFGLFVIYVIVGMVPFTPRDLNMVLIGTVLGGVIAGGYSINQYLHGVHPANGWERLVVTNGDESIDFNHFAASLQTPIALTWVAIMACKQRFRQFLFAVPLAIMFVGMLLGASRGGIIGLGAMTLYLVFKTRKFKAMFAVLALAGIASLFFPSVYARFTDTSQGEGSGRLPIWRVGFEAFRHHWLAGVGVGNFQVAYDQSFLKVYQDEFQGWSRPSHNVLVGTATELGIIGLALLVLASFAQFRSMRVIDRTSPYYPIRIALEASFIALIAESMFIDILWYKYLWLAFSLMAAVRATALTSPSQWNALPPAMQGEHRP